MMFSARMGAVMAAASLVFAGCNDSTEPEMFDTGSVEFEWLTEGETSATAWTASGSCGSRGFDLGSSTCAVGADEIGYWAALGVFANEDDTYDTLTLIHPSQEGECEAAFEPGTTPTCTVEFIVARVDFPQEPVPQYIMTSGTINVVLENDASGNQRLVGTFEGVAEDFSDLQLDPIAINGGMVDVHFVR